jgi:4-amino-4-deoxy-L-arabinose transferase-like glycosyltransferase
MAAARFPWRWALLIFAVGLACRIAAFSVPHDEGDEIVYHVLVQQLESGHGYTLAGTPLIGNGWPADQYGHALFFHPPGGIALFWLLDSVFGENGFALAQVFGYALFYWSLLALGWIVLRVAAPDPRIRMPGVGAMLALAAFQPLMTHVVARYWLDGPMLALVTLAAALFARACVRLPGNATRGAIAAGLALGAASWTKTAALVALPAIAILGIALVTPASRRGALRLAVLFTAVALLVQAPWEIWQWRVLGSPFPAWAGRPSPTLVANNAYVRFLTVDRPPWIYLTLMPRVVWTLIPSLLGLALLHGAPASRRIGVALALWIAIVLSVMVGLGAIGYSKLLRYAILVTPATVLLFACVAAGAWGQLRASGRGARRATAAVIAALAAAGFALEIAQGIYTPLIDRRDLIWPLLWRGNGLY